MASAGGSHGKHFSILVENQNTYVENSTKPKNQSRRQQVPTNEKQEDDHGEDNDDQKDEEETPQTSTNHEYSHA